MFKKKPTPNNLKPSLGFAVTAVNALANIENFECSQASIITSISLMVREFEQDKVKAMAATLMAVEALEQDFVNSYWSFNKPGEKMVLLTAAVDTCLKLIKEGKVRPNYVSKAKQIYENVPG